MRTLVIGGAASGKSARAEVLALAGPAPRTYVATLERACADDDARVARHALLRAGKGFRVLECPRGLAGVALDALPAGGTALLEGLGTLVANEMFAPPAYAPRPEGAVLADVLAGVRALARACADVVVVTDDVGRDGTAPAPATQAWARVLARANAALAAEFEQVMEVVFGLDVWLKGGGELGRG